MKNRYLSLMNKWSRNKSKKTNKEIEMRIINTIKRNIERSAIIHSQEAININSSEEVNNESTINH